MTAIKTNKNTEKNYSAQKNSSKQFELLNKKKTMEFGDRQQNGTNKKFLSLSTKELSALGATLVLGSAPYLKNEDQVQQLQRTLPILLGILKGLHDARDRKFADLSAAEAAKTFEPQALSQVDYFLRTQLPAILGGAGDAHNCRSMDLPAPEQLNLDQPSKKQRRE